MVIVRPWYSEEGVTAQINFFEQQISFVGNESEYIKGKIRIDVIVCLLIVATATQHTKDSCFGN